MLLLLGRKALISPMSPSGGSHTLPSAMSGAVSGSSGLLLPSSGSGGAASSDAAEQLAKVPQFASLGKPFKSSAPIQLTESETEFAVSVVKHVFQNCIVLEYTCTNTLPDTLLENVHVTLSVQGQSIRQIDAIPAAAVEANLPTPTYAVLETLAGAFPVASITNVLQYVLKEKDPHTGAYEETGYQDQYQVRLTVQMSEKQSCRSTVTRLVGRI